MNGMQEKSAPKKILVGQVISDKMDKTVVVKVTRTLTHPRFDKVMRIARKYKVHDERQEAKTGDIVEIFEGRPASKTKYMYLSRVIKAA